MRYEISVDDGFKGDLQVADLLDKYDLKATFFIPVVLTELTSAEILGLSKRHTIGAHTMTHPYDLKRCNDSDLHWELGESKRVLEKLIKKEIDYFCYPRGRFDERVKQAVKDAGFKRARTARQLSTDLPTDLFEIETALQFFPNPHYKGELILDVFNNKLIEAINKKDKGYFHFWFHSTEIERLNLWDELEKAFKTLSDHARFYSKS